MIGSQTWPSTHKNYPAFSKLWRTKWTNEAKERKGGIWRSGQRGQRRQILWRIILPCGSQIEFVCTSHEIIKRRPLGYEQVLLLIDSSVFWTHTTLALPLYWYTHQSYPGLTWKSYKTGLCPRRLLPLSPGDIHALVKLVKIVEIVETVETVETAETVYTEDPKKVWLTYSLTYSLTQWQLESKRC